MLSRAAILPYVPVDNRVTVIKKNYNTQDIIDTVLAADQHAAHYTAKVASSFRGNSIIETASNIWQFLKNEITYIEDPDGIQDIKAPSQLLQTGFGDCKSYSVFTASILRNLGIRYRYRFASYKEDGIPTHVYVLAQDEADRDVIIDAVWHSFNSEKKYTGQPKDYIMQLRYISGTGQSIAGVPQLVNSDFEGTSGFLSKTFFKDKLEDKLRTGAQFFLYCFIHKQALPASKQFKWVKAMEVRDAFLKKTGLKEASFYRFIGEEIKLQTGKTPEELLPKPAVAFSKYTEELRDNIQKDINWRSDAKALNNDFQQNREKWYRKYGWMPFEEWYKIFWTGTGFPAYNSAQSKQLYDNYYSGLINLQALNHARTVNSNQASPEFERAYQIYLGNKRIFYDSWYNWMKGEIKTNAAIKGIGAAIGVVDPVTVAAICGVIVALLGLIGTLITVLSKDVATSEDFAGFDGSQPGGNSGSGGAGGGGNNGGGSGSGSDLIDNVTQGEIFPLLLLGVGAYMAFS